MTAIGTFRRSLIEPAPPEEAGLALQALWWVGKDDWNRAHACAQQGEGQPDCDWAHAYLHRVEGDAGNAAYWYRRAGQPVATIPHAEEWERIVEGLLSRR